MSYLRGSFYKWVRPFDSSSSYIPDYRESDAAYKVYFRFKVTPISDVLVNIDIPIYMLNSSSSLSSRERDALDYIDEDTLLVKKIAINDRSYITQKASTTVKIGNLINELGMGGSVKINANGHIYYLLPSCILDDKYNPVVFASAEYIYNKDTKELEFKGLNLYIDRYVWEINDIMSKFIINKLTGTEMYPTYINTEVFVKAIKFYTTKGSNNFKITAFNVKSLNEYNKEDFIIRLNDIKKLPKLNLDPIDSTIYGLIHVPIKDTILNNTNIEHSFWKSYSNV